jgi:hypothetical protein
MTMTKSKQFLIAAVTALALATGPLSGAALAGGGGFGGIGHGGGHNFNGVHEFHGHGGFVTGGTNCWVFKQTPEGFKKVFICGNGY